MRLVRHNMPSSGNSGTKLRLLEQMPLISIVDDDESVRDATKSLLRSFGYTAQSFASAEEFLELGPN